jgi:NADH-quinone oxidoreductase subunit A
MTLLLTEQFYSTSELSAFGMILLYILVGVAFVLVTFGVAKIFRPNRPNTDKNAIYECGEEAVGEARVNINARYYVPALLFVLFELEVIFLFPFATVYADSELQAYSNGLWMPLVLTEITVFMVILGWGLVYAWKKGYLQWDKPEPVIESIDSPVPSSLYEEVNKKYSA